MVIVLPFEAEINIYFDWICGGYPPPTLPKPPRPTQNGKQTEERQEEAQQSSLDIYFKNLCVD